MVAEQVLKPRMAYLCGIIGELVGRRADDPCVVMCALSVQAQFQGLLWHRIMPTLAMGAENAPETLDAIAEHITHCSLGGVRGFQKSGQSPAKAGHDR